MKFCGQCGKLLRIANASAASDTGAQQPDRSAERRQITVMFCDLVGSTALSERLDPEDLRVIVRKYQALAAQQIEPYAGHIAQYLGDGLLIYFGFPQAHEDDAIRAVHSAISILSAMTTLNLALLESHDLEIAVRIGIHTGSVVTGEIGVGNDAAQLAVGLTPNIAARVQGFAQPGEVLLSETTQALLGHQFNLASLGAQTVAGSSQPIDLYRVQDDPVASPQKPALATFVGRQHECDTLVSRFDRAAQGQGQLVFISAEPGHGKSRLEQQLRHALGDRAQNQLVCQCSAYERSSTLHPFIELVEQRADITPTQSAEIRRERLERFWRSQPAASQHALQPIVEFLGLSDVPVVDEEGDQLHLRAIAGIEQFLLGHAESEPLLLTIEDLHWADQSSLDLIKQLSQRLQDYPILLICSARPSFVPTWPQQAFHTNLFLAPLSDSESKQMVIAIDGGQLPDELRDTVVQRADGVPLYLEEITHACMRQLQADRSADNEIPMSLRDLLMARLDELGESKEVIQLGALLGRRFSYEILEAVSHLSPAELGLHLRHIVEAGLLLQSGAGVRASFTFKHVLVQDAAYEALLRSRRRELHEQVIVAMRTRFPRILDATPEMAARHFEGAEKYAQAVEYYRLAGRRGAARWSLAESTQNYLAALDLLARMEESNEHREAELAIRTEVIAPLTAYLGYGHDDLVSVHKRIVELQRDSGDLVAEYSALVSLWGLEAARGNRTTTPGLVEEILQIAQKIGQPDQQAIGLWVAGSTAFFKGRLPSALNDLQGAMDQLGGSAPFGENPLDYNGYRIHASLHYAWAGAIAGDIEGACMLLTELEASCIAADEPFALAQVLCHWCVVLQDLDELPEKVLRCADATLAISKRHGMRVWVQYAHLARGWARVRMGNLDAAEEQLTAVESYSFDENTRGHSLVMMADTYWLIGDEDAALGMLDRALAFFDTNLAVYYHAEALRLQAEIRAKQGGLEEAWELAQRASDLARDQGALLLAVRASATLVELSEPQPSTKLLEQLANDVDRFDAQCITPHVQRARALLARHISA